MNTLPAALGGRGEGAAPDAVARRLLLHAALRRWSRSPHATAMVLRGGLMTQLWVGADRRATRDLDFLALFPPELGRSLRCIEEVLATDVGGDAVTFDLETLRAEVIWQETAFPGHRFLVSAVAAGQGMDLQIDVGFGDPLVPPAHGVDYPTLGGPPIRVQAVRPELLVAWKLHGLFEHGARRWRAKDLFDLHLLTSHWALEAGTLAEAIHAAFASRGDALDVVPGVVYSRDWWQAEAARKRWAKFRAAAEVPVPDDVAAVAATVARALRPAVGRLVDLPADEAD